MLMHLFNWFAAGCASHDFLGLPPWYKYLVAAGRMVENTKTHLCELNGAFQWDGGGDVTLVLLGIMDILLRLAALVAVGFIVYAGIQYITSDGEPGKTKEAQSTIINALVGLFIALIAVATVSFIGHAITKRI